MVSGRALLFVAVAVAAVLGTAHGASYTVGAPAGSWDLQTNYAAWASSITFRAGDQLVFRYSRAAHNVLEVSKAGYDSCSGSSPLAAFQTGDDTVPLPRAGVTRYFICGVPGHCAAGMKLAVRVVEAAGPAAAPSPAPTPFAMPPRRAAGPPTATPTAEGPAGAGGRPASPPPPSSAAASVESVASLGVAAVAVAFMALY